MNIRPTLDEVQRAGFPMGAESLVALDLADTLVTVTDPPTDLLAEPSRAAQWWQLQASRLPEGPVPDLGATRRLRAAIREVFEAYLEQREPEVTSVDDLNAASASVPVSLRMVRHGSEIEQRLRWHGEYGGNAMLAAIAREAIDLRTDPERRKALRRCASPTCSMLFLAENKRRVWCTANLCGNRARVARHYDRTHGL